jgi:6-pyruvoyltetrahydropterin/6-carboxytetrahydropterin synthase
MILTLQSSFSSAHFYNQPAWSKEQNEKTFGACYTKYGHGHNYTLQVSFKTSVETYNQDQKQYQILLQGLAQALDHEHLNFVIPEFKTQIPTTENIAQYFFNKLTAQVPASSIRSLRLYEMENLWTEIQP